MSRGHKISSWLLYEKKCGSEKKEIKVNYRMMKQFREREYTAIIRRNITLFSWMILACETLKTFATTFSCFLSLTWNIIPITFSNRKKYWITKTRRQFSFLFFSNASAVAIVALDFPKRRQLSIIIEWWNFVTYTYLV